jgi:glycine cleavage system aminomethyltransferase T
MRLPHLNGPRFDRVTAESEPVGVSGGQALSVNLRATISLCVIDPRCATPRTEVTVRGTPCCLT